MRTLWPDRVKVCMNCGQRIKLVQDYDGQVKWKALRYGTPDLCDKGGRLRHWPVEDGYLVTHEEVRI